MKIISLSFIVYLGIIKCPVGKENFHIEPAPRILLMSEIVKPEGILSSFCSKYPVKDFAIKIEPRVEYADEEDNLVLFPTTSEPTEVLAVLKMLGTSGKLRMAEVTTANTQLTYREIELSINNLDPNLLFSPNLRSNLQNFQQTLLRPSSPKSLAESLPDFLEAKFIKSETKPEIVDSISFIVLYLLFKVEDIILGSKTLELVGQIGEENGRYRFMLDLNKNQLTLSGGLGKVSLGSADRGILNKKNNFEAISQYYRFHPSIKPQENYTQASIVEIIPYEGPTYRDWIDRHCVAGLALVMIYTMLKYAQVIG